MPTIPCKHCGKDIEVVADLAQCPHCQRDIGADIVAISEPGQPSTDVGDILATADTAHTAMAGTAQRPVHSIGDQTIDSANVSPNLPEYSATLKAMDSAFDSIDLSSAIPPRAIATDSTESTGDAQDYRLGEKLGSGSFGVVYRAEQIPLLRTVALKMLKRRTRSKEGQSDETNARAKSQHIKNRNEFLREAQFTGKLEHPNIVPVHDIGLIKDKNGTGNRPFYVMKEIKGDSWQSKMKTNTRNENLEILKRVAEAIDYAHDKNIIHGDLKPENVMLGEFGEVLVVDWGQAVDLTRRETYRPGGSPAYVSPEMARYWCEINLDGKETSTAINDVGKHSDVYLLGAILFEIVTQLPPHFGLKGETQIDVMRRAIENQIRNHDSYLDDELMQIARRALRLDTSLSYDTVGQFEDALRDYESQRISIELRDRANKLLAEAKEQNDYDAFGKARFGFEESIEKWEGNQHSKTGLLDARLSCANLALKDQNFDLGIGMLEDPETREEKVLRKRLVDGKRKRDTRKRLVGLLSILLILGGIGSVFLMNQARIERGIAAVAKKEAGEAKAEAAKDRVAADEAITLAKDAEERRATAERLKNEVQAEKIALDMEVEQKKTENEELAMELMDAQIEFNSKTKEFDESLEAQVMEVQTQTMLAKEQTELANKAAVDAREASFRATEQAELAQEAKERNRLLQIESSIVEGDYATARVLLKGADPETKEWKHFNARTQPEAIEFLHEKSEILSVGASQDGNRIVIVKNDSVSVHQTNDFDKDVKTLNVTGASVAAVSPDGRTFAIGIPGGNGKIGKIQVIAGGGNRIELDNAPSKEITDLQFSSDGERLLCVGDPNAERKSARLENQLMVYQRAGGQWTRQDKVFLAIGESDPRRGTQPEFSKATFSDSGEQILVTHPGGDAHIYKYQSGSETQREGYVWKAGTSSMKIDAAIFANDDATQIVGCHTRTEANAETNELFLWNVSSPGDQTTELVLPLARLNDTVRSLKRSETTLLTGGDSKEFALWALSGQSAKKIRSSKGHSKEIDFCTFIPGEAPDKSTVISIAVGSDPEIMKTDLAKYEEVPEVVVAGDETYNNSPLSIFHAQGTNRVAVAKDNGHAVVQINGENVEWEVSAWRNHVLTRDFLFAQSGRDNILQYDRKTGAIKNVLSQLSQIDSARRTRIIKFQVSDDGKTALTATTLMDKESEEIDIKEFQVWDLETQSLIKRLKFGDLFSQGRLAKHELPTVALSPDGRYVVAGKVGFVVWSTLPGDDQPIFNKIGAARGATWPNRPINNVIFFDGGNEFAVSWPEAAAAQDKTQQVKSKKRTGRIHLYKKQDRSVQLVGRFRLNIIQGGFDTNRRAFEPNTLGAKIIDGQRYILIRSAESIDLLKLNPGQSDPEFDNGQWDAFETVQSFKGAKFASFSGLRSDILILNKRGEHLAQRWSLETKQLDAINVSTPLKQNFDRNRFAVLDSIYESSDGSITLQSLRPNRVNQVQRDYNTVTLNQDLSISALRVLSKPSVDYAAVVGDRAITLEGGSIRNWKLVFNQPAPEGSRWSVRPDGILPGNYDLCLLSPDERQLLVKKRGSGRILSVDPLTGKTLFEVDSVVGGSPSAMAWSRDSNQFAIGFDSGELRVLNVSRDVDPNGAVLSKEHPQSGSMSVRSLAFSADGSALLVIFNDAQTARIYRHDDIGEGWYSLAIGFSNAQKQIVAGDISEDGNRVITGSNTGQLTIWNAEGIGDQQEDPAAEDNLQQMEQRELFDLVGGYSSDVRFVRFFKNPDNKGQIDVVAAAQGEPNPRIWKTSGQ